MLTRTPPVHRNRAIRPANRHQARPTTPKISAPDRGVLPDPAIVVVSQDSLLRWALYEALVAARFRVLPCSDEAHAREILPRVDAHPDLAIIDEEAWLMTRSERSWLHTLWPDLPIVVLAHHGQGLEHRLKELGLADVLFKPFDVAHLIQMVERLVAARRAEHRKHVHTG